MTGLLPILIICLFTLWTVFEEGKLSSLIKGGFLLSLAAWVASILVSKGMVTGFPTVAVGFLGLALYGFVIQRLVVSNPLRIVVAAVAVSPFFVPGLNVIDRISDSQLQDISVDPDLELLVKVRHDQVAKVEHSIAAIPWVSNITKWTIDSPDLTTLDDYLLVNISEGKTIYRAVRHLEGIKGILWIEENEQWSQVDNITATSEDAKTQESISVTANDPRARDQWNYQFLQLDKLHSLIQQSGKAPVRPAKLYIVDSGVDYKHEDLQTALISHPNIDRELNESDKNGHGTHCAGVAAAVTNNGVGIASANPGPQYVTVGSVAAMNRFGIATQARIVESITEAIDAGADVINMSFGGASNQISQEVYKDLFEYAAQKNVILVAAAGNSAADAAKYVPSGRNEVITVAAINKYGEKAQFSNYITNTNYGLAAPGTSILSTYKNGYATFDGTSMAAPHVAGIIAVMKAYKPNITTEEAYNLLATTGRKTREVRTIGPIVQPHKALEKLLKSEL